MNDMYMYCLYALRNIIVFNMLCNNFTYTWYSLNYERNNISIGLKLLIE